MLASERPTSLDDLQPALPWQRWGALVALLLAEIVGLSVRFDTSTLSDVTGEWALAVAITPRIIRVAILAMAVTVAYRVRALTSELQASAPVIAAARHWPWLLALHLGSLSAFIWLTREILERGRAAGPLAPAWAAAWLFAGATTVVGWALAAIPFAIWKKLAASGIPALAVGFCVGAVTWSSELIADGIWQPLARCTLWCSGSLLQLFYPEFIYRPSELAIGTSSFAVTVDPDCSGYEGLALILAFLGGYLWFDRDSLRLPRALVLLPLGAVASLAANVLRMTLLVAIGSSWSEPIAMGGFHSQAGAIAFSCIALGLVVAARHSTWLAKPAASTLETENPTAAYLTPFLAILAVGMLTSAFSPAGADPLYPLRVFAAIAALWHYRARYASCCWAWSWPSLAIGPAVFALWLLMAPSDARATSPAVSLAAWPAPWRAIWWGSRIGGYLIVTPIVEELAFRGFLLRRLQSVDFESTPVGRFSWRSWGLSSLAFGALHGGFWIAGALAGLAYAWASSRRGRLADAVLAHSVTNGLLFAYVLTTGNWALLS